MDAATYLEWFGYLASVIVAISLLMSSLYYLRWINLIGACLFSVYGLLIDAFPVFILNAFIVGINGFYLFKLFRQKESFSISKVAPSSTYLMDFLRFYEVDIRSNFPNFDFNLKADAEVYFLLRDIQVAGVVIVHEHCGIENCKGLMVDLDYTTPVFRDFKLAKFFFKTQNPVFAEQGIERLISEKQSEKHNNYLKKNGFVEKEMDEGSYYVLDIANR